MNCIKRVIAASILGCGLLSQSAFAGDCAPLLADLAAHSLARNNYVKFVFSGAQEGAKWGVFTEGTLDWSRYMTIKGQGTSYFSVRKWYPPQTNPPLFHSGFPFNPRATEQVDVEISRDFLASQKVYLTLTLLNWGNAQYQSFPTCDNGMMHGVIGGTAYAVSFEKVFLF